MRYSSGCLCLLVLFNSAQSLKFHYALPQLTRARITRPKITPNYNLGTRPRTKNTAVMHMQLNEHNSCPRTLWKIIDRMEFYTLRKKWVTDFSAYDKSVTYFKNNYVLFGFEITPNSTEFRTIWYNPNSTKHQLKCSIEELNLLLLPFATFDIDENVTTLIELLGLNNELYSNSNDIPRP